MSLSFADSLKKAKIQSNVKSVVTVEPMTLESDDDAEFMIEAYSGEGGNWIQHSGYDYYSDYSDNDISKIDDSKNIELHEKQFNITQEENSQYIPFEMNRYYDGFDLTKTVLRIYYVTNDGQDGSSKPINVSYNNEKIRFAWLVDGNATHVAGKIKFEIWGIGTNSNGNPYVWKTKFNDKMNVLQSLEKSNGSIVIDKSWVQELVEEITENISEQIANLQVAEQVNAAKTAASDASTYASNAQQYANDAASAAQTVVQEALDNYATTTYVDDAIKSVDVSEQLKEYALKNEIPTVPTNISAFENDVGYITQHQSLEAYALKSEIPSVEGLATETYVQEQIENADLDSYYKKTETYNQTEIDEKIANVNVDLTGYATEKYVNDKIAPLSSSVSTNAENISSLSTTVGNLQDTVNSIDISPRVTYDVVYNDAENPDIGENGFGFYEIQNEGKENEVRELKQKFTITGGSGGSATSSSLKIGYVTTSPLVVTTNDDAIIKYTFSGTDSSGDDVTEGTATWKVAGRVVATNIALNGENTFDITEYLSIGTQKVNLSITDEAGSLATKTWTVQKIDVRIESTFNDKFTYPIDKLSFDYTPYGAISKNVHFVLDGKEIGTITTSVSGVPMAYTIPEQAHGSHLLEVYMTAEINGNTIESNHITKDILWYDGATSPVIGTTYQNFTARQYDTTNIEITVYDPSTEAPTVEIIVDGVEASTQILTESTFVYPYKTDIVGTHTIEIKCGEVVKTLTGTITKLDINVSPVTAGLVFDFNPIGKSNNDADRIWSSDTVSMSVSDNFNWTNGGYQIDDNGDQYFCIKAGTNIEFDYQMFADDAKKTGKEMKLIFKTANVQEANAKFMSCVDNTTGTDHIGIEMFVHEAFIYGSADKLNLKYSENDIIEFEFNITKNTEDVTEICGYEDGVPTRHLVYDDTFNFTQSNPKTIKLGSNKCDLHIYRFKVYNTSLTDRGVLSNFIADARNAEEMINRYNRNQIYDENNQLTPDVLAEKCPWLRVYVVSAPYFTNKKSDKVPYTTIRQIYKNGDPILDNWTCYDCSHSGQGTSSDNYGASARNLDFIMNKSQREGVTPYFILGDGKTRAEKVSLTRTSIPNAYFNFKANVASSNHFTNALLAKRYNEFNPYTLPYVREDESIIDYIKTTMEFHNAVVFIQETGDDLSTHREFADKDIHFYSIGNIGDSKKTDKSRLVDPTDRYECINEICDVELPLSDWPNTPEAIVALESEKFDKSGSYEWRYIWEDGTDEENVEVKEYCKQKWIEMYKFVVQSTDEEFKANFSNYFVLDSVLYYYLFALRYCLADNLAKNSFWHYGKTGEIDAQGNPIRKWDLSYAYDMD